MFPETEQKERFQRFLEHSYDLFSQNLYDEVGPTKQEEGEHENEEEEVEEDFSYAMDSESAPHFPLTVRWNARFMEFDPLAPDNRGGVGDADIDLAFGPFTSRVKSILWGN